MKNLLILSALLLMFCGCRKVAPTMTDMMVGTWHISEYVADINKNSVQDNYDLAVAYSYGNNQPYTYASVHYPMSSPSPSDTTLYYYASLYPTLTVDSLTSKIHTLTLNRDNTGNFQYDTYAFDSTQSPPTLLPPIHHEQDITWTLLDNGMLQMSFSTDLSKITRQYKVVKMGLTGMVFTDSSSYNGARILSWFRYAKIKP